MRRADFRLPPESRRSSPWWLTLSVGLHVALAVGLILSVTRNDDGPVIQAIVLLATPERPEQIEMPWEELAEPEPEPVATPVPIEGEIAPGPVARSGFGSSLPDGAFPGAPGLGRADSLANSIGIGRGGRFIAGPAYGSGRLWVPTIDVVFTAGELVDIANQLGTLDSTVAGMIMAFLDSVPQDSMAFGEIPSWTTQINGQTWGTDGQWIYLGPVKIPAIVLALLPLPQGNYDQARAMQRLQNMRADLLRAARAMEDRAIMQDYIRDIRERVDRERERRHNREEQRRREQEAQRDSVVT